LSEGVVKREGCLDIGNGPVVGALMSHPNIVLEPKAR
jgi:hypothetical protein